MSRSLSLRREWSRPLLIWLAVSSLFIISHFSFYFQRPHYEGGDFAANALQIREAKVFRELYGNYSRFGFHHPGPAFFYAYALGETVFYDTLKVVPAAYNAHAITGILIQALFFTWALVIVTRRIQRPLLLPLLLAFAGLHFSIVNYNLPSSAFVSIWPPYVLLFPFLCFLVACASLASGEIKDLVPCLLAGGLLVHGHVAQPLFVLPLFLIAGASFWFIRSRTLGNGSSPRLPISVYVLLSATCLLALFLLPLILDACRAEQSNLRLIARHFSQHATDHKTLAQSVTYLVTFFYYAGNPEKYCDQLSLSSLTFLVERWPFLLMWIFISLALLLGPRPTVASERRFYRCLGLVFVVGLALSLIWGRLQNAEMFAFNAYFNFALLYVPLILLSISLASRTELRSTSRLRPVLYAGAIVLGIVTAKSWAPSADPFGAPLGTKEMVEIVRRSASEDPQGRSTKFLTFEQNSWEWAAGVALALERSGYSFAIAPRWSFIFGTRHAADLATALRNGEVALWTIKSPASGDTWISNSVPAIDPANAEIAFSGPEGNAQAFVIGGWEVSNGPFSWSTEKSALLYFTATPASADVQIDFHVFPFNFSSDRVQRMSVSFNNEFTQTFEVARNAIQSMRVPFEVWNRRPCATLAFDFPDATSPKAAGQSADERLLGCGFTRIAFHPYHAVSTIVPRLETKTASLNALAIESTRRAVNMPAFVNDD